MTYLFGVTKHVKHDAHDVLSKMNFHVNFQN